MTQDNSNILVLTETAAVADSVRDALAPADANKLRTESTTLAKLNGKAAELAFRHQLVIFEADPDNEAELQAIADLAAKRQATTRFIALTDENVSLAKVQLLRAAGVTDVLPVSISRDQLGATLQSGLTQAQGVKSHTSGDAVSEGVVLAVSQARGGIGATTFAVNLAHALLQQKASFRRKHSHRVALVDFDLQFGNLNVFVDIEDNGGLIKLIESHETPDAQYMRSILQRHKSGLDVLCAPAPIAPLNALRPAVVAAMLDVLRAEYDYIVVDLPRAMVDWLEPVLARTARLAIVTDTSVPCVRQCKRLLEFYREANLGLPVDLIVNREKKPQIRSQHLKEAEAALETGFSHWIPDNPRVARKAADLGRPITELYPRSDIARAYRKLANATFATLPVATMKTR